MTSTRPATAHSVRRLTPGDTILDRVVLSYEDRLIRRKRLLTVTGTAVLADLAQTVSLDEGDALVLTDGSLVAIEAAAEELLEVTGPLVQLAWHIGNRHTPCQIEPDRIVIRQDKVMRDMLAGLGATLRPFTGPFTPGGGAYGHGRTMGHDHGHSHHGGQVGDPLGHDHSHDDPHDHPHHHSHGHTHEH
jgi:urease accessory protein